MQRTILIASHPEDLHAIVIAEALRRKGADVILWQTSDFPNAATETVFYDGALKVIEIPAALSGSPHVRVDSVWLRRPDFLWGEQQVADADLRFTQRQCRNFREGLLKVIHPGAFWVNPPGTFERLRSKIYQHEIAAQLGFTLPVTAYTNDPRVIHTLLERFGEIVYKPLSPVVWQELGSSWGTYTTRLTKENLIADPLLQAVPGIYQEVVPKEYELRVTIIGRQVFTARIRSQECEAAKLDWRAGSEQVRMEADVLDPRIEHLCLKLMDRLGIVFGCLDFIVRPDGEHVFLEINTMGQFLFVERLTGLRVTDAMCELLLQGRPDFNWPGGASALALGEVIGAAELAQRELAGLHLRLLAAA